MRYPGLAEYNAAVLSPQRAFLDPQLASSTAAIGGMGLPQVLSGGLAFTYRLDGVDGNKHAVRCFRDGLDDRLDRYRCISSFLAAQVAKPGSDCWVNFTVA